jgi:undecaprenyl diphosphate synthase
MALGPAPSEAPAPRDRAVPRHVAIIMDGNGRWATRRHLPRVAGHRAGTKNIRRIVEAAVETGVEVLTLYAFSTENWRRPDDEVSGLMALLAEVIDRETDELRERGAQVRHVGSLEGISPMLRERIRYATESTKHNTRLVLNVAFNYGGRAEIIDAVKAMMNDGVTADDVSEKILRRYLYEPDMPDPDLVIRTSGEFRISNFLLWELAYSELVFTPVLWPDFRKDDLAAAIREYQERHRRFGGVET